MDQELTELFAEVRFKRPELDDGLARMQALVQDISGKDMSPHVSRVTKIYLKKLLQEPGRNDRAELEKMLLTFENIKSGKAGNVGLYIGVAMALGFIVIALLERGVDVMTTLPFLAGGPVLAVFAVLGRKMISPRLAAIILALAGAGLYYGITMYLADPNKDVLLVWGLIGGAGVAALTALSLLLRPGIKKV